MWRKGLPHALLVGVQTGGKQYEGSSKNKKWVCLMTQWFHFWEYTRRTWNANLKEHMHPYVYCSVIYHSQAMEATHVPINRWVDKKPVVNLHNGILLSHIKELNLTICESMNRPRVYYAQWNKSVRERKISHNFICMWNLKNNINE